jgi:outer membrane protein assembly factor BamB
VARFAVALALLLVAACVPQSQAQPSVAASPNSASSVVWKSERTVDFSNSLVGDLELMAGSLVTLTGEGTTVTGTEILAVDPESGRTRWADATLNGMVAAGPSSSHHAHFLRDGDDLIALVTDSTSSTSAVIRFSVSERRPIWLFGFDMVLFPESLAVHDSFTCFAGQGPVPQFSVLVTCLGPDGRRLWTRKVEQGGSSGDGTEIEIAASKLMVVVPAEGNPGHATASVLDLETGEPTTAAFQVDAGYRGIATRHLATWKEDKVVAFLPGGIAIFDLSSPLGQPRSFISLAGLFPRAPEVAVAGSTVYVKYDMPYPTGGDQPKADVVAAFDLESGKKLWEKTDPVDPQLQRMRPMRLQGSDLLYGDHNGDVWVLAASTGAVRRHVVLRQEPQYFLDRVAPLESGNSVIVSQNFGPGPLDYRLAAIQ